MCRVWNTCIAAASAALLTVGCNQKEPDVKQGENGKSEKVVPGVVVSTPTEKPNPGAGSFKDSVLFDVPDGENCPPGLTYTKKSVAKIFEAIRGTETAPGLWDQVRFVDAQGRKLQYSALVKTDAGDFRIALLSDAAPDHVKNFVALARAGYYDGLPFHKSVREEVDGKPRGLLEAGCPRGSGELGYGSIGYWLKPEIHESVFHEDGTVGAWSSKHPTTGDDLNNASCKFYIALGHPVGLDGNYTIFGKVVQGLEVAHTMNRRPIQPEDLLNNSKNVVHIRQVQIEEQTSPGGLVGN